MFIYYETNISSINLLNKGGEIMKIACTICGYEFEVDDDAKSAVCPACEAELDIPEDVKILD